MNNMNKIMKIMKKINNNEKWIMKIIMKIMKNENKVIMIIIMNKMWNENDNNNEK